MPSCLGPGLAGHPSSVPPWKRGQFLPSGSPESQKIRTEAGKDLTLLRLSGAVSENKLLSRKAPLDFVSGRMTRQWNLTAPKTWLPSNSPGCCHSPQDTPAAFRNTMSQATRCVSTYKEKVWKSKGPQATCCCFLTFIVQLQLAYSIALSRCAT